MIAGEVVLFSIGGAGVAWIDGVRLTPQRKDRAWVRAMPRHEGCRPRSRVA